MPPESGRLEERGIVELVQYLSLAQKSARLDVAKDAPVSSGVILVAAGRVVHAATSKLRGSEAFYEIGSWTHGSFAVTPEIPVDRTIAEPNDFLILELLRRIDLP